ncbi:MAG: hypothetical protein HY660_07535 [Armatimonadetes bacterium]|nr:hypothetical protein [Armatimonadota bacterium]
MADVDEQALRGVLVTMAQSAGVTLDEETVTRLVPTLRRFAGDWRVLTRAVVPEVEPMAIGRWPEDTDAGA